MDTLENIRMDTFLYGIITMPKYTKTCVARRYCMISEKVNETRKEVYCGHPAERSKSI